ncbi:MAG: sulfotransferase domain-containing protein [Alphaproteobacteria bacterium]|nr:sulfotransferase domain-containing protein [Alphaproteobacteria bacterium]MBV9694952.1 sulfotransferase domain-containing protein [Alphaproteobacteria bacterium]
MLIQAPRKEVRSWTTDSRRWAHYRPRPGDVVIATAPKCGTTWTQQIVSLLIFQSGTPKDVQNTSPWIDFRLPPIERMMDFIEGQTHRRFLKSHLPFDALPIYDDVRYIHVARHGLDAFMSWHNHTSHYSDTAIALQGQAGMDDETIARPLPRPLPTPREQFDAWMTEGPQARLLDDAPASHYFDIERSWWRERGRENVLLVHYSDLKSDLEAEMRRIAAFMDIEIVPALWPELVSAAGFGYMREHGATIMPRAAQSWDMGHKRFLNEGTNGRWRTALSDAQIARFEEREARELDSALRHWLNGGRRLAGEPRETKS